MLFQHLGARPCECEVVNLTPEKCRYLINDGDVERRGLRVRTNQSQRLRQSRRSEARPDWLVAPVAVQHRNSRIRHPMTMIATLLDHHRVRNPEAIPFRPLAYRLQRVAARHEATAQAFRRRRQHFRLAATRVPDRRQGRGGPAGSKCLRRVGQRATSSAGADSFGI